MSRLDRHVAFPLSYLTEENAVLSICAHCGELKFLPDEELAKFPDQGWWLKCHLCHTWANSYKISSLVREPVEDEPELDVEIWLWELEENAHESVGI